MKIPSVLIVDDEVGVLNLLEAAIANFFPGATISRCSDLANAIDMMTKYPRLDIILTDMNLKGNGHEGADIIAFAKSQNPLRPVILLSASDATEADSKLLGADAFVPKPILGIGTLKGLIMSLLEKSEPPLDEDSRWKH